MISIPIHQPLAVSAGNANWNVFSSLPGRIGNGGGDRSRTCIALRPAVFKTAAIPLCDPSALTPIELYRRRRRWLNPHLR